MAAWLMMAAGLLFTLTLHLLLALLAGLLAVQLVHLLAPHFVIAAPIVYAYVKKELSDRELI